MSRSQVDVTQLIQRDPAAWTAVLHRQPDLDGVTVTAVVGQPIRQDASDHPFPTLIRYRLTLADHSDPITCIGKRTTATEAHFYHELAPEIPQAPRCWFAHIVGEDGWVVIDDVPHQIPPQKWSSDDALALIDDLAHLHAAYWEQEALEEYPWLPHFVEQEASRYTWEELESTEEIYFAEGPGATLSEHAVYHLGRLAPTFLRAANGLHVMRSLNGWPGILGESHMRAAAELLDDPVPMLERLHDLPLTLLHGNPHNYHWAVTLFDDRRLLDWNRTQMGPAVIDLVKFVEQFNLLFARGGRRRMYLRDDAPVTEETLVDTYMIRMNYRLQKAFDARAVRKAIPAARCLHVLTTWFPYFATWFDAMPNVYAWQKLNRLPDEQLAGTQFEPLIGIRPYLQGVFHRFLRASYMV